MDPSAAVNVKREGSVTLIAGRALRLLAREARSRVASFS